LWEKRLLQELQKARQEALQGLPEALKALLHPSGFLFYEKALIWLDPTMTSVEINVH
jgi:hypothetical protein